MRKHFWSISEQWPRHPKCFLPHHHHACPVLHNSATKLWKQIFYKILLMRWSYSFNGRCSDLLPCRVCSQRPWFWPPSPPGSRWSRSHTSSPDPACLSARWRASRLNTQTERARNSKHGSREIGIQAGMWHYNKPLSTFSYQNEYTNTSLIVLMLFFYYY